MNWSLIVADPARKELERLPPNYRDRVLTALRDLANDPHSGDIARLRNTRTGWRRRVGNYRIIYDIDPRPASLRSTHRPANFHHLSQTLNLSCVSQFFEELQW
jgi:mRNA interferase RelE/StbE